MSKPKTKEEYDLETKENRKIYDNMIKEFEKFDDYKDYKHMIFPFVRPSYEVYLRDFEIEQKLKADDKSEDSEPIKKIID
jgi:hypothetical protein